MILILGMWGAGIVVVLSILLKIPGLELLLKPVFQWLGKIIEFVTISIMSWVLLLIGTILRAHKALLEHLTHEEAHFDIKLRVERLNRDA